MLRWGVCDECAMKGYTKNGEWTKGTRLMFDSSSQCVELYQGKELISSKKIKELFRGNEEIVDIYMDWKEEKIMWRYFHTGVCFAVTMPVEWINNRHTLKLHPTAEFKNKGNQIQFQ